MKSKKANSGRSVEMGSSCTAGVHYKFLTTTKLMVFNVAPSHLQPHKAHFVNLSSSVPGEGR